MWPWSIYCCNSFLSVNPAYPNIIHVSRVFSFAFSSFTKWLEKVLIPLEFFHILSSYKHKIKCILLGFYVIDQQKAAHNCEVEGKRNKNLKRGVRVAFGPFTICLQKGPPQQVREGLTGLLQNMSEHHEDRGTHLSSQGRRRGFKSRIRF